MKGIYYPIGPDLNPHKAKVAWAEVCKPKEEGGLGLRCLKEVNKVTCLKLIWPLNSTESLWVNWIHNFLIRKGSFWAVDENTSLGSWMWKKLLKYRGLAEGFFKLEIGNGERTYFWQDIWSSLGRIHDITGDRGYVHFGIHRDATLSHALCSHRKRNHRAEIYNRIETEMELIKGRYQPDINDRPLWKNIGGGYSDRFQSKDTWLCIKNASPVKQWSRGIWFQYSTPKYAFITWLAVKNRLATTVRMKTWNVGVDPLCVLFKKEDEDRDHLFFGCEYAGEIWTALISKLLQSSFATSWEEVLGFLTCSSIQPDTRFLLRYAFQMTIYHVWTERNRRKHGEKPIPPLCYINRLDKNMRNRLLSIRRMGNKKYYNLMEIWFASR